jgi:protein gp37
MAENSKIEWTDATWNPITGCSVVSPGCTNCYAMRLAGTRLAHHPSRAGLTQDTKAGPVWTGEVRFNEQWLDQPLRWSRPRMIFVCAHGDLFHESVPDEWIDRVFAVMALAPHHTFQVLTKRAERMRAYLSGLGRARKIYSDVCDKAVAERVDVVLIASPEHVADAPPGRQLVLGTWPLPNVWLGVSAEDQKRADERIPHLLATPAAVRWVSAEPLIGPVAFDDWWLRAPAECEGCDGDGRGGRSLLHCPPGACPDDEGIGRLDWIVAGGESGPGARPSHPEWFRSLRDQCAGAGVPFFFKQHGDWLPFDNDDDANWYARHPVSLPLRWWDGAQWREATGEPPATRDWVARIGKKAAGRLLDGIEHNGMPGDADA